MMKNSVLIDTMSRKDIERFEAKFISCGVNSCWNWKSRKNTSGYGSLTVKRKSVLAHIISYVLYNGPLKGLNVLHTCDNPSCVNPAHLFLGTMGDNMRDMVQKRRHGSVSKPESVPRGDKHYCYMSPEKHVRGESHGMAKLTKYLVDSIRYRHQKGDSVAELSRESGVSSSQIYRIINFESWAK